MKRTEATDEAVELNDQVPASGHDTAVDKALTMEQRRRRLVRGAAALAPLVLTLRSGALAAASCTGVVAKPVLDGNNEFSLASSPQPGDICVTYVADACPDQKISAVTDVGILVQGTTDPTKYQCTKTGGQLTTPIAVLSGAAARSFGLS